MNEKNHACSAVAIELENGVTVTGKSSDLMTATAAAMINGVKEMAHVADEIHSLGHRICGCANRQCNQHFLTIQCRTLTA